MKSLINKLTLSNGFLAVSLYFFVCNSILNMVAVLINVELVQEITSKILMPLELVCELWAGIRLYKLSNNHKVLALLLCLDVVVPLLLGTLVMFQLIDPESLTRTVRADDLYSIFNTLTGIISTIIMLWGANVLYKMR